MYVQYLYVCIIRLHEFVLTTTERRRTGERAHIHAHTYNTYIVYVSHLSLSFNHSVFVSLSRAPPHVLRPPQTHSIMVSHVLCMRALVWFRRPGWRKRMYLSVCVCVCVRVRALKRRLRHDTYLLRKPVGCCLTWTRTNIDSAAAVTIQVTAVKSYVHARIVAYGIIMILTRQNRYDYRLLYANITHIDIPLRLYDGDR